MKRAANTLALLRTATWLLLSCVALPSLAGDTLREQEIAQCQPGEISSWDDQQDRPAASTSLVFFYQHALAPEWFDAPLVLTALRQAAQSWSQCGIAAHVAFSEGASIAPAGSIAVRWSDVGSRRNFGLANLGDKTLSLGPAAFQLLKTRNPNYDARQTLQMVIAHEMGHFFGLMAHSRRCVDVTSYYDNGKGEQCLIRGGGKLPPGIEYRSVLPTACDIQRCRLVNSKNGH